MTNPTRAESVTHVLAAEAEEVETHAADLLRVPLDHSFDRIRYSHWSLEFYLAPSSRERAVRSGGDHGRIR